MAYSSWSKWMWKYSYGVMNVFPSFFVHSNTFYPVELNESSNLSFFFRVFPLLVDSSSRTGRAVRRSASAGLTIARGRGIKRRLREKRHRVTRRETKTTSARGQENSWNSIDPTSFPRVSRTTIRRPGRGIFGLACLGNCIRGRYTEIYVVGSV